MANSRRPGGHGHSYEAVDIRKIHGALNGTKIDHQRPIVSTTGRCRGASVEWSGRRRNRSDRRALSAKQAVFGGFDEHR
jgi:hypothetical protein